MIKKILSLFIISGGFVSSPHIALAYDLGSTVDLLRGKIISVDRDNTDSSISHVKYFYQSSYTTEGLNRVSELKIDSSAVDAIQVAILADTLQPLKEAERFFPRTETESAIKAIALVHKELVEDALNALKQAQQLHPQAETKDVIKKLAAIDETLERQSTTSIAENNNTKLIKKSDDPTSLLFIFSISLVIIYYMLIIRTKLNHVPGVWKSKEFPLHKTNEMLYYAYQDAVYKLKNAIIDQNIPGSEVIRIREEAQKIWMQISKS